MAQTESKKNGAGAAGEQPLAGVARYRFTVTTPDKRRLTSGIVAVQLPPNLDAPQWSRSQISAGETAVMAVMAPGRDGQTVDFFVERQGAKGWDSLGHASATVKDGRAEAEYRTPFLPAEGIDGKLVRYHEKSSTDTGTQDAIAAHHEITFRARTADGREVRSHAMRLWATPPPPAELKLGTVQFGHGHYVVGDVAALSIQVLAAEGKLVRFVLQRKDGDKWVAIDEARAEVREGVARAHCPIAAAHAEAAQGPMQLRVQALVDFAASVSAPVKVDLAPKLELSHPEWSSAHPDTGSLFAHGEEAAMRVQASGNAEGRRVRFVVERKEGEEWKPYATAHGVVHKGFAVARVRVEHVSPDAPKGPHDGHKAGIPSCQLRFRAEVV
jgi:hypothetical protein